ncbi:MAG TPA: 2-amino-4-hydroxy-6-hydroxymethyldihydropteridine diphosphokinase [Novosphingobium sp.]|nr:2-amino-4-hydroxy-6-hydroxymethyldihydropteridine diphosphokinase [Novosphingobium sp.]
MEQRAHRYVIALGSNRWHHRHGRPRSIIAAALEILAQEGLGVLRASSVVESRPLGPSRRTYANAVALIETGLAPEDLLECLKHIEQRFGRRAGGRRWTARVLDLDIVLWDFGPWASPRLLIPHPAYRQREFVLCPMRLWGNEARDPLSGLTPAHLHARLTRPRPTPKPRLAPGLTDRTKGP